MRCSSLKRSEKISADYGEVKNCSQKKYRFQLLSPLTVMWLYWNHHNKRAQPPLTHNKRAQTSLIG